MSHVTICGARGPLSAEARAEIEAFADHLRDHHATRAYAPETCRFCAENAHRRSPISPPSPKRSNG